MTRLRTILALAAAGVIGAQEASKSVWDGVYTRAQAERGHIQYDRHCADCHGDELDGDPVEAPSLAGGDFMWKWNGATLDRIFERIHRDMPLYTPGSLSREASAEILAYMLQASDLPAGSSELPHDAQTLKQIRMEAAKPDRKHKLARKPAVGSIGPGCPARS